MAEFMLKELMKQAGNSEQFQIESAGTWATDGIDMVPEVKQVLTEHGIPFTAHRSRNLTEPILAATDIAFAMETGHKEPIQIEFPQHRKKVVLLTEYVGTAYDILDPMGEPVAEFFDLARDLDSLLTRVIRKLTN